MTTTLLHVIVPVNMESYSPGLFQARKVLSRLRKVISRTLSGHLTRAVGLLVLGVGLFLVLRWLSIPASFGQYGFYRGENVAEWANIPLQHAGTATCQSCHQEAFSLWEQEGHRTVSCENCHGPSLLHVEQNSTRLVVDTSNESCALCHSPLLSRPSGFPQVALEKHYPLLACAACHAAHDPGLATLPVNPHPPLQTFANCLLCHGVGRILPFPNTHAGRGNETCSDCHEAQR